MILYLIHDLRHNTYTAPLVADTLQQVQNSLKELNPENLLDLELVPLSDFTDLSTLRNLRFHPSPEPYAHVPDSIS